MKTIINAIKSLPQKLGSLPVPLRRQVVTHLGLAAVLLIFGLLSAALWRDKSMLIIIAVAVFFAALGVRICYRDYIVITGICIEVEPTIIRKRNKAVTITTMVDGKEMSLRIPLRQQFRKFAAGDTLEVYIDTETRINEWDGIFHLQTYIVIDKRAST